MNSFMTKLKRFISNKNTVTILCVIIGIVVLYVGYNYRVSSAIDPVRVPYAKNTLESRHLITAEDIGYIEVNRSVISNAENLITDASDIIDQEVTYGNTIQKNSLFFKEDVTNPELAPDYVLNDIQDGYTAFSLSVDRQSTYGNRIYKGDYIDLWFNGEDDSGRIIYANLVESIQVLDVRDTEAISLENAQNDAPNELLFAVPDELYSLLVKAQSVGDLEAVPRNRSYTAEPGETKVASEYVRNFILSKSATIPDEEISTGPSSETDEKGAFHTEFTNLLDAAIDKANEEINNGSFSGTSKCYSYEDLTATDYLTPLTGYNGSVLITIEDDEVYANGWFSNDKFIIENANDASSVDNVSDANGKVATTTCQ